MSVPTRRILDPIFGAPLLRYQNSGMAGWCKENSLSQWQKGSGWTANLYGGAQSGDDWAAVFIPVNELDVTELKNALWTYYMTNAETMGVNMVIWVHSPDDNDKRAEITQLANVSGLAKASGWNAHELDITTDQFFFYGENTTGTGLTAGADNLYGWDDFQADALFGTWTIYRISFEYGWEMSGTFEDAWIADIKLNGERILLKPSPGDHVGGEVKTYYKATVSDSTTKVSLVTPAATKRIRVISLQVSSSSTTGALFEAFFHTGTDITTTPAKAILAAWLDADLNTGEAHMNWPDGPVGGIGEVVSMRTSVNVSTAGHFTIVYREE